MSEHHTSSEEGTWWIARPENTNKLWYGLVLICCALVSVDFLYHAFVHEKHGYFVFETAVAFHAIYGFGAFVFVVLLGKELRKWIMRSEDYYAVTAEEISHDDHHDHSSGHHADHGDHHA